MAEGRVHPLQPRRYLGLELAGAKNQKTSLAVLEFYPKEQKVFLLDIYDRIAAQDDRSGDEVLMDTLSEIASENLHEVARIGVNVPTTLPPCITCTRKTCPVPGKCSSPSSRWMRKAAQAAAEDDEILVNVREVTPYTQRPFEIWARYRILPSLPIDYRFDIDEALGGARAPLTARMHFLRPWLARFNIVEVWPKLTISTLAAQMGTPKRIIRNYRKPEQGFDARMDLLENLALKRGVFIYDRDLKKLASSLTAFDAFLCAYTALLADLGLTASPPRGYPQDAGWVHYPALQERKRV